jgi:hypothetical protein
MAAWIVIAVGPVYRYFDISRTLEGSRYLYLASAGWAILIVSMSVTAMSWIGANPAARAAVATLVVIVWALILRTHLVPWREASALRDETLNAASATITQRGCGPGSTFREQPDSVRGAYVFRNGFAEAIGGALLPGRAACESTDVR